LSWFEKKVLIKKIKNYVLIVFMPLYAKIKG
jgi:hypothetical protein